MPGFAYGFSDLHNRPVPAPHWSDALQGSLLLALGPWLAPRVMRHHLAGTLSPPDLELAARAQQPTKLDLAPSDDHNRRVLAVLAYLDS